MYEVSTAYKNYIKNNLERDYKVRLTVGTDVIDSDDIFSYSIETNQPSDKFTIGNAISKMLKIEIKNQEKPFYTNQLYLQIGMLVNGAYEYVPIGYFNVDKSEKKDHRTTITAYDNMYKLEGLYVCKLGNTKTIKDILTDITSKTGIKIAGLNYKNYTISDEIVGYSHREVIAMMAGLNGGNAYIDRTGKIKFVYLSDKTTKWAINDFYLFDGNSFKEQSYTIDKVTCYKDKDTSWSNGNLGTTPMEIQYENPFMTEAIAKDIYNKLANINYQAFNMETMSYLALDVGDWITYTSQSNTVYSLCIQHYKFSGGIKQTLEAKTDGNKNNFNTSGSLTQKVNRTITDLLAAKKAIIDKANISDLVAGKITVETLNGGSATLQEIMTSFISGSAGQFLHLTGQNVVIDEAVIKDLIASRIKVSDLMAGTINTNNFNIVSEDGGISIVGSTQQFKDKNGKVRLQLGKDAEGNFTFVLVGADGTTAILNENGITKNAIPSKVIVNDMVADNANIDGSKVNIESLIECVNNNNTKTLNASKIVMDGTTQTLEANFKKVTTNILYNQAIGTATSHSWNITTTESNGKSNMTHILYKVLSKKMKVGTKVKVAFDFTGDNLVCKDNANKCIYFQGAGNVTGWNAGAWCTYAILKPSDTITEINKHYEYTFTVDVNGIKNDYWTLNVRVDRIDGDFSLSNLMIQVDEPFVDFWTKSIWDEEDSINTLQTKFDVHQGKIEQLIKDTTITTSSGTKTLKDAYNETKTTVDGTVQTVSKMETQVNSLNLTNLIRAGGGDYLNVSTSIWGKTNFTTTDMFTLDGATNNKWYRIFNTSSSTASNSGLIYVTNTTAIKASSNKKISISFRYYCNDSNGKLDGIKHIRMYILQEHNNSNNFYNSYKYVDLDKTTAAKLYKGTFELNANCTRYMIRFDLANNAIASGVTTAFRFKDIMVVNGSVPANEWSPSFEDLQVDINSVESRVSSCEVKTTDEAFTVQVQKNQNRQFNVRYIRDYCNGNNSAAPNYAHWLEIQAITNIGTNLCKGITAISNNVTVNNRAYITDGDYKTTSKYASATAGTVIPYVQIDLGKIYNNIDEIKVWHFYSDGRIYNNTKTEVSADGTHWVTLFDSAVSGTYVETIYGHSIKVNGTSFNSSQVTINELGLHVKNGAIDIQNNSGDTVFGADTNGNLNFLGTMKQKDPTTGRLSTAIKNNGLEIYDWRDMDGTGNDDLVGGIIAVRNTKTDRGGIMIYSDIGNLLHIGYKIDDTNYNSIFEVDSTKQQSGGLTHGTFKENITFKGLDAIFADYSRLNFYGNDYSALLGKIGLDSSNQMFVVGKRDFSSPHLGYLENNNSSLTYKLVVGDNNKGTTVYGDFNVSGTKNRVVKTKDYNWLGLNAFETAECYFGDWLFAKTDDKGYCMIYFEDKFLQTINTKCRYHVMCSAYGNDDDVFPRVKCIEQKETYFIIKTDVPGTEFSVLVSAKQKGYENTRLKNMDIEDVNQADVYEELNKIVEEENKK